MTMTKKTNHRSWSKHTLGRPILSRRIVGRKPLKRRQHEAGTPKDAMLHNWLLEKDV